MKFQNLFYCIVLVLFFGCQKNVEQLKVESNELFFIRNSSEKFDNLKSSNSINLSSKPDFLDTIINALKQKDKTVNFSNKIVNEFGVPKWDYFVQIKNSNGGKTLIIPVFNEKNKKVDLLIFLYGNEKNQYKVKFVIRNLKQSKIQKNGDKYGKTFTDKTLAGLFESLEKNIVNSLAKNKNSDLNLIKSNDIYLYKVCWYYTWSDGMSIGISNTQCSYTIIFTPDVFSQINGGGFVGLPEIDLNTGGGIIDPNSLELTEAEKLEALLNCTCNCPEDDTWVNFNESFEPKWGQLGDSATLKKELLKIGVNTSDFSQLSLRNQLDKLQTHFFANRNFQIDNALGYVDVPNSKKVDRYFYTFEKGWIDLHHFFYAAYLVDKYGPQFAANITSWAEFVQLGGWFFNNKSGFSYEDMASNAAGVEFYLTYRSALNSGTIDIQTALMNFLSGKGITDPVQAPNYHFIPHVLDGNVPQSISPFGLTGDNLKSAAIEAYCKKSTSTKEKIKLAHKVISHSSNK